MSCKHYKDALIEAAAAGAEPQGELRAHLAVCPSCREAFTQEQFLFSSIDASLHSTVNAEVPPSLLPRVRAGLEEAPVPRLRWMQPFIFASASLALAFFLFLIVRPQHTTPEERAGRIPGTPAPAVVATNGTPQKHSGPVNPFVPTGAKHPPAATNSTLLNPVASSKPEVLVPPDEREAMARFVAALSKHQDFAAAVLAQAQKKKDALLTVNPLQIADIDVKPLEGSETETTGSAAENR